MNKIQFTKNIVLLLIILSASFFSCNSFVNGNYISLVKKTTIDFGRPLGIVNVDGLVVEIADIDGTVAWKTFNPIEYKDIPNVIGIQVDIEKHSKNKIIHNVKMQFLLNKSTNGVKLILIEIDNKPVNDFGLWLYLISEEKETGLNKKNIENPMIDDVEKITVDKPKINEIIEKGNGDKQGYFSYEPNISTISGIVQFEKFYGRFNFGGSPESDEREDSWILYPETPINMNQSEDIESNNEKVGVTTIHLIETKGLDLASYNGKVLQISGTLSGAISGHHHAKVLMNVLSVKVDKNDSFSPLYRDAIASYQKIVRDWNEAHNSKNFDLFSMLFSDKVDYYHTVLPKKVCIQKKIDLFQKFPNFDQQIIKEIEIEKLEGNEIKCNFTKQVVINQKTTYYPSYLILKKSDVNWEITVEGDLVTDKNIANKKQSR